MCFLEDGVWREDSSSVLMVMRQFVLQQKLPKALLLLFLLITETYPFSHSAL